MSNEAKGKSVGHEPLDQKGTSTRCPNPQCMAENTAGQKFCGQCGQSLNPDVGQLIEWALTRKLEQKFKDHKVVEVETAEAIANRLIGWAKIFGTILGAAVAILVAALGIMGLNSSADFQKKVEETTAKLEVAAQKVQREYNAQAKDIKTKGEQVVKQFGKDQEQLAVLEKSLPAFEIQLTQLQEKLDEYHEEFGGQVAGLKKQVGVIEDLGFGKTSELSSEQKAKIEAALKPYRVYLTMLGLKDADREIPVYAVEGETLNTFFVPGRNAVYIDTRLVDDTDLVLREFTHYVLFSSLEFDFRGASLGGDVFNLLESGLADYFPCSYLNKATVGEGFMRVAKEAGQTNTDKPWIRNLDNDRTFTEISRGANEQNGAEVFGGAFWDLRKRLTREVSDALLARAWMAAKPNDFKGISRDVAKRFRDLLLEQEVMEPSTKVRRAINDVFAEREVAPAPQHNG